MGEGAARPSPACGSTATDQMAATLGRWFGVSGTDLLTVLPNLVNYSASERNLGFV